MKRILLAAALLAAGGSVLAQTAPGKSAKPQGLCATCGTVQDVNEEQRKGKGGAVGIVGGAVVGGLLGNQIGGGSGRTLATVGGAAAGGYVGNEVQKKVTTKTVWVTRVRMKDGSIRTFEQDAKPSWTRGAVVKDTDGSLSRR